MRKLLISCLVLFFLNSCTSWNSKCSTFSDIEVKHVYDDGIIAKACTDSAWTKSPLFCKNTQEIFLEKNNKTIYYDGKNIDIPHGTCAIIVGSKSKNDKTYPLIEITNPNSYNSVIGMENKETTPDKTIRNPKCESFDEVEIFQVLDDFSLAHICEDTYCVGNIVYIPKQKGLLHYDNLKIKPNNNQCFNFNGTYKYESTNGKQHTIPKITMIDAKIPNPEYLEWKKTQQKK